VHGRAVEKALSNGNVTNAASVYMVGRTPLSICQVAIDTGGSQTDTWAIAGELSEKCVCVWTQRSSLLLKRRLRCSQCSGNHRRVCAHMLCVGRWLAEHAAVSARSFEEQYFLDHSAIEDDEGDVEYTESVARCLPPFCASLTSPYRTMLFQYSTGAAVYPDIFCPATEVRYFVCASLYDPCAAVRCCQRVHA
jgi:hypothetical protein